MQHVTLRCDGRGSRKLAARCEGASGDRLELVRGDVENTNHVRAERREHDLVRESEHKTKYMHMRSRDRCNSLAIRTGEQAAGTIFCRASLESTTRKTIVRRCLCTAITLHTNTHGFMDDHSESVLRRHTIAPQSARAMIESCCKKLCGGKKEAGLGAQPRRILNCGFRGPREGRANLQHVTLRCDGRGSRKLAASGDGTG